MTKKAMIIVVVTVAAVAAWFIMSRRADTGPYGTVLGTVRLGPTCPVQRNPPDPACADKPYMTTLALASADGSHVYATFTSSEDGTFSFTSTPGEFSIVSTTTGLPRCSSPGAFEVRAGTAVNVAVTCDTGIR